MLIVFEGGEGSGKSTQARRLAEWLTERGVVVTATHEPGATDFGARMRQHPARLAGRLADAAGRGAAVRRRPGPPRGHRDPAGAGPGRCGDQRPVRGLVARVPGRRPRAVRRGDPPAVPLGDRRAAPDLIVLLDVDPDVGLQRARAGRRRGRPAGARVARLPRAGAAGVPRAGRRGAGPLLVVDASRHPDAVAAVIRMRRQAAGRPAARSDRCPARAPPVRPAATARSAGGPGAPADGAAPTSADGPPGVARRRRPRRVRRSGAGPTPAGGRRPPAPAPGAERPRRRDRDGARPTGCADDRLGRGRRPAAGGRGPAGGRRRGRARRRRQPARRRAR